MRALTLRVHGAPGEASLLDDKVGEVALAQPDGSSATADLYNAIEAGNYPVWYFFMQTMDPTLADSLPFDPLDPTKVGAALPCPQPTPNS